MISFTGIIVPLLVVASLMSGVAATDFRSLFIDTISVPGSMKSRGYTPLVFIRMMNDRLLGIEATAKTRTEAQRLRTEDEKSIVSATVDMLSLTPLVRAVQMSSNLIEFRVNGEIGRVRRRLSPAPAHRSLRPEGHPHRGVMKPQNDVHGLADLGAERIMRITDPQVFCAAVMQHEAAQILSANGKLVFNKTDECITETLPTAQDDDTALAAQSPGGRRLRRGQPARRGQAFPLGHPPQP